MAANVYLDLTLCALAPLAFAISLGGTLFMRRIAPRWGLMDRPDARKQHRTPTPLGGGIAIFVAVWLPVLVGGLVALALARIQPIQSVPPKICDYVAGVGSRLPRLLAVCLGALVLAGMGLIDDRRSLSPYVKLFIQLAVAVGLVASGERISIFIQNPWICGAVTVIWVVCLTNAFNLLDNMDGLSAGVALIVSCTFLVVAIQTEQYFVAAFLVVLAGALGGFLVLNFPPASIFMGDCGSMLIGYLLAVITIDFTFYLPSHPLFPVIVPLLILAVPIFDTLSVVAIRLHKGRSPFAADRNHFSHRLVKLGMSERQAVLTIYLVTIAVGLGATHLYHTTTAGAVVALVQAMAVFGVIVVLERAGRG